PYTCSATSSDSMSLARAGSRLTASVDRATTRRSTGAVGGTGADEPQAPRRKSKQETGDRQPATGNGQLADPALPVACCLLPLSCPLSRVLTAAPPSPRATRS